jgi:hypothetical protein
MPEPDRNLRRWRLFVQRTPLLRWYMPRSRWRSNALDVAGQFSRDSDMNDQQVSFLNIRDRRGLDRSHQIGAGGRVRFPSVTGESEFSEVRHRSTCRLPLLRCVRIEEPRSEQQI